MPSLKALDRSGNVIQLDSFSKIAFPGLRVGWCIGAESAIERLRLVKQSTDLHTDQLAQATLAEFVRRGYLARHLSKMKKVYRSRLEAIEEALEKHMPEETRWTRPEGGMSIWVTLPAGFDTEGDIQAPWLTEYVSKFLTRLTNGGRVDDRHVGRRVGHQNSEEKCLVTRLQIR